MSAMFEFARVECQDTLIEDVKPILACRVCLSADRPLRPLVPALTIIYEQLTFIPVSQSDIYPKFLCSFCRALLFKFGEFRKKCHSAQETVLHLHSAGIQITKALLNSGVAGLPYPHLAATYIQRVDIDSNSQPAHDYGLSNQQDPDGNNKFSKNVTENNVLNDFLTFHSTGQNSETCVTTQDEKGCIIKEADDEILLVPAAEDNDADSVSDDTSDIADCLVGFESNIFTKDSKKSFKDDRITFSKANSQNLTKLPKSKTPRISCKQIGKKVEQEHNYSATKKDCFIKETVEWIKQFKAKKNGAKNMGISQEPNKNPTIGSNLGDSDDFVIGDHDDNDSSICYIDSVDIEPQMKCLSDINSGQGTLEISNKIDKENKVKVMKPALKIDKSKHGGKKDTGKAKKSSPDPDYAIKQVQKFISTMKKKKSKLESYHERLKQTSSLNYNVTVIKLSKEEQIKQFVERKGDPRFKNAKYKCEMCNRGFTFEYSYKNHMADHEPKQDGLKLCDICNIWYPKKYRNKHNHSCNYVCNECGFISKTSSQAIIHYGTHKGTKYACKICGKTFDKPTSVYGHMHLSHGGSVECSICGEKFIGQKGLRSHMNLSHKEAVGAVCSSCSVQFHSQSALRRHRPQGGSCDTTHRPCAVCGEGFLTDELLNKHKSTHSDSSFVCETCGKIHTTLAKHKHHVYAHLLREREKQKPKEMRKSSVPAHLMCEFCGVVKKSPLLLKGHRRTHTKPFQCDYCQKRFAAKVVLEKHIYKHMSIPASKRKQHPCRYCSKTFLDASNKFRHEKMVHMRCRPFTCDSCGNTYQDKFSLHNHINTKHLGMPWPKRIRSQREKAKK